MADDRDLPVDDRNAVDSLLRRASRDDAGRGRPLTRRARQTQRSVEDYLNAGNQPRWMTRIAEIEAATINERRRLERMYRRTRAEVGHDPVAFAARWRGVAESWSFERVNELIRQHNDWFPIERQLPMDPRTRDYVLVHGRSHRRRPLDAAWVLEHFPLDPARR